MFSSKIETFESLYIEAAACRLCPQLADRSAVLGPLNGSLTPKVMFIGEAPGRVGADRTRRPFYGDKSGNNFQVLLDSIGLSRDDIFITSAVMCSPRSATDANRRPTRLEIRTCSSYLRRVLDVVHPPMIATLGSVALEALGLIEYHELTLSRHAGTLQQWNSRRLVPLYHPSPQVFASSRRLDQQIEDYRALAAAITDTASAETIR